MQAEMARLIPTPPFTPTRGADNRPLQEGQKNANIHANLESGEVWIEIGVLWGSHRYRDMRTSITRADFLKSAAAASVAVLPIAKLFAETPAAKSRPNLLLFTSDDLGIQVGCYGDPFARTAHHDKLAAQGVRFETAYVTQSSCSPSRSSMLTGLYPHQNGQIGLATLSRYATNPGVTFLPNLLKKAGYSTSVLRKIHIAPESAIDFDFAFVNENTYLKRDIDIMTREAQKYIKAAGDNPFFMMYNSVDPHRPLADQMNGLPEKPQTVADVMSLPFLG